MSSKDRDDQPLVIVRGESKMVFLRGVDEIIEADEIKGGVHLTLDPDFWK